MKQGVLKKVEPVQQEEAAPLRIDFGCGKGTPEGWVGIDIIDFGQAVVADLSYPKFRFPEETTVLPLEEYHWDHDGHVETYWTLPDDSVDEARSSHFVEHLSGEERISFFNELYRVLKPKATALIVTPNWSHSCAYGDPTHKWPPMSQWYPLYLHKEWRGVNAPHVGYTCDFDHVIAGSWDQSIELRNPETKSMMMNNYTNTWRDLIVTLTKR